MKKETRKIGSCYKVSSQASAVYLPSNAISFAICAGVHGYAMGNVLVKKKSDKKGNGITKDTSNEYKQFSFL